MTIPSLMQAAAEQHGNHPAIEDDSDGRTLSYAELAARAERATAAFMAAGVERGDRVAIWAPNCWEWVVAALGLHGAGAALVPLNTRYKGREAAFILRRSRAKVLLTVTGFLDTDYVALLAGEDLPDLRRTIVLRGPGEQPWSDFIAAGEAIDSDAARARIASVQPEDLSDILFTSGTTGAPKGVMCTHAQTLKAFEAWSEVIGLKSSDRYLVINPFFHAFGYKAGWLASLMRGATIVPQAVFDAATALARIPRDRISMLPGPPALYQMILAHPDLPEHDLSSLRLAVTGAAVIPTQLILDMREKLGFETVITGYGLTEACGIVSMCRFDDDPETIATTSGRAIPGVEMKLADDGEILVRGYNVMKGYLDDPEATAATVVDGWLHTGDIGELDDRGYVRITDRKKDMFIVGGFNAYPAEIETLLLAHPAVGQAAVVGRPDARLGEVGVAFVVPSGELDAETLIAWCRQEMANYKVPREVRFVTELPRNALGKVTKFVLRAQLD